MTTKMSRAFIKGLELGLLAGRILVSPELRSAAGLDREIMLLGMGSHLEIWDANTYASKEKAAIAAVTYYNSATFL
jgi:DNA-binding transcriptional regulator/RsmH inhibitor MraZ